MDVPEQAAYRLFRHIATVERKGVDLDEIRQGAAPASRQWILSTFSECLRSVRREEAPAPAPFVAATGEPAMGRNLALPGQPLDKWILAYSGSDAHKARAKALAEASAGLTSPATEVALICGLIEHLQPALAVEIGTYFGQTARPMAETLSRHGGKLITIDPYGDHRVPGIIGGWPEPLRTATDFRPIFSMELFARIEEKLFATEGPPKIGVAFVDGNHKFEYALFDIMEAADNLSPGGAIVVDNLEQQGPRLAVLQFLRLNPAWKLYYLGKIWSGRISTRDLDRQKDAAVEWGVLVAPAHLQVAMTGRKFSGKLPQLEVITGVRLNVRGTTSPAAKIAVNLIYTAWPHDYHLTGKGAVGLRREAADVIKPGMEAIDIAFDVPGQLPPHNGPVHFIYQLETTLLDEDACVLLDAGHPFEFKFAPRADRQASGHARACRSR